MTAFLNFEWQEIAIPVPYLFKWLTLLTNLKEGNKYVIYRINTTDKQAILDLHHK